MNRRKFLKGAGGVGMVAAMSQLGALKALADTSSDYKALVCVFLFGGNDSNNMIIPYDSASYTNYANIRGGLALAQSSLVPLSNPSTGLNTAKTAGVTQFALHPALSPLKSFWDAGQMAVQFNTGPLAAPTTRAQIVAGTATLPTNLFSHADQQQQWQATGTDALGMIRAGWGGRAAEHVGANLSGISPVISVSGNSILTQGDSLRPLSVPTYGSVFSPLWGDAYLAGSEIGLRNLASSQLELAQVSIKNAALAASSTISPIINNSSSAVKAMFSGQTSAIAVQLATVAMLIESRAKLAQSRQVFFVSLGGFDTHTDQLATQQGLYTALGTSVATFMNAMNSLGLANNVTVATMSDFGRTFKPNSTGGADHAWGGHQFILGGAVKGKNYYGTFPTHQLAGPNDYSSEGRWIPTTSVEQYAATLATWLGVPTAQLASVAPNLSTFTAAGWPANLGFMG
ncbi:DUF1501 domain-containing protein [Amantichitinum ursilacus]|uniref:DUF1501 domain-containing protein n=1 Tax=Amantichitinum ursilacus TaxID=857265 RepID=A0A0N0XHR7_9NEIS|nr:DUF1501 domain-containing protein [Amantichitinum ursilacus]KPC49876.1 hypothetical protein WG78_19060 [Amantichitinum ursilacus]